MQVIAKANDKIAKLWGRQKQKDTKYRLMKYTLSDEIAAGHLLQNAMTGELILLDAEEWRCIEELPCKAYDAIQMLIEKYFLVPIDYDEHKTMLQLRAVLQTLEKHEAITGYTILPTTHCNARCFYCYESNVEHIHMTSKIACDVVDFIEKKHGNKPIHLGWFGGEPLVGLKRIDQICEMLEERKIEYSSFMITNGYLFNQECVERAKEKWKLKSLQITLDGTEEVYNQVKQYVSNSASPYKMVMRNISLLLDEGIEVSIRLNMDKHNHSNLIELIDELSERFGGRKGFSVNIAALFDNCGFDPVMHTSEEHEKLKNWLRDLNNRIKEKNLAIVDHSLPMLRSRLCMADHDESIMITPQGDLHKCDHHIDDLYVGNIYDGITEHKVITAMKQMVELPECYECPLQPNCYHIKVCKTENHCKNDKDIEIERVVDAMNYAYSRWIAKS